MSCSPPILFILQGAYFIGKAVWGKGYRELINLGAEYEAARPEPLVMDVIGVWDCLQSYNAVLGAEALHGVEYFGCLRTNQSVCHVVGYVMHVYIGVCGCVGMQQPIGGAWQTNWALWASHAY